MSTALSVVRNQSIRWSAPTRFNDPFDVPRAATVDFSVAELRKACDKEYVRLIDTDGRTLHPRIRQVQDVLRVHPDPEVRKALIREYLAGQKVLDPPSSDAFEVLADIWRTQVAQLRILCTSEVNDSASMWDRYADRHCGVVFELGCGDDVDSALVLARQIIYRDEPPRLPGVVVWAKAITLQPEADLSGIWSEYFYVKRSDWSNEREWRVITFAKDGATADYTDYPVAPGELLAVYVGYRASGEQVASLLSALGPVHGHVRVYREVIDQSTGRIAFIAYA